MTSEWIGRADLVDIKTSDRVHNESQVNRYSFIPVTANIFVVNKCPSGRYKCMTTISVKESTKRDLLKVVSDLQIKLGRRVDFDRAIEYLLTLRNERRPELLEEACTTDYEANIAVSELIEERRRDEKRSQRYSSF